VLRKFDLDALYPGRAAEIPGHLHIRAVSEPQPEVLFALAEINFLLGCRAEAKANSEAYTYFYRASGYAYHYLFDAASNPSKNAIRRVDGLPDPVELPAEAYDPRFRLACDLYNAGLAKCIHAAQNLGQFDPRSRFLLPDRQGQARIELPVRHHGFALKPEEFGPVQLCSQYEVVGLENHHRSYGLGVPLIGSHAPDVPDPQSKYHPKRLNFPITAFFRFDGSLADLYDHRDGWLELCNPLTMQSLRIRDRLVPLETDLTTPLAHFLSHARLEGAGLLGFFRPDSLGERAGLHTLEPYQPGKIPVILVHGLLGSPITWAPMFNDLQADPAIRKRYQFWVYFYPSGSPYLDTAAKLRADLARMKADLDPHSSDSALSEIVMVGHSMGGLVSRLMTIDGGDDFWRLMSPTPLQKLQLEPLTRVTLRNTFYFERQSSVTRAVFLGTPHHGSKLSPSLLGRLGARLAGIPLAMRDLAKDILDDNPQFAETWRKHTQPTSIDLLAPDAPALQLIAARPKPPSVRYHSVIGVTKNELLLERLFGGGYCHESDGVVLRTSAHLDGVDSEIIVPADHYHVHQHPLAILEVRRILLEHLESFDERHRPVRQVSAEGQR
jgi:pimeloyl-ACP methyl ester carboxylesterase